MALLVSIESSTTLCSVALHNDGALVGALQNEEANQAAGWLAPAIQQLLQQAGVQAADVMGVAVSAGPGSYTGLRVGVATAKGLAFGLGIPLLAVETLRLLASQVVDDHPPGSLICPMLDARREEVYCAVYNHHLMEIDPVQAVVLTPDVFAAHRKETMIFVGSGALKFQAMVGPTPHYTFRPEVVPLARHMGSLAHHQFTTGQFENQETFEPVYLKEFLVKTKVIR